MNLDYETISTSQLTSFLGCHLYKRQKSNLKHFKCLRLKTRPILTFDFNIVFLPGMKF